MPDGKDPDIQGLWLPPERSHNATITQDEQAKIDEHIRTRGVTICPPSAAIGDLRFDDESDWTLPAF